MSGNMTPAPVTRPAQNKQKEESRAAEGKCQSQQSPDNRRDASVEGKYHAAKSDEPIIFSHAPLSTPPRIRPRLRGPDGDSGACHFFKVVLPGPLTSVRTLCRGESV